MERIQEEMVKMSQDERDRYLYLREEMAASDRVSQLQSAENRRRFIEKIKLKKKKIQRGDSVEKIADDLMEDIGLIKKVYEKVKENTEVTADEIYQEIN